MAVSCILRSPEAENNCTETVQFCCRCSLSLSLSLSLSCVVVVVVVLCVCVCFHIAAVRFGAVGWWW